MAAEEFSRVRAGTRKVQERFDGTRFVTIPKDVAEAAGIEGGDVVDVQLVDGWPIEIYPEE